MQFAQIGKCVLVAGLCALLEAWSVQNDNLTLPLYMWTMLSLIDVST
jgi:dolichol kinase